MVKIRIKNYFGLCIFFVLMCIYFSYYSVQHIFYYNISARVPTMPTEYVHFSCTWNGPYTLIILNSENK